MTSFEAVALLVPLGMGAIVLVMVMLTALGDRK